MEPTQANSVAVFGIGADGWESLDPASQQAILAAEVVLGGTRQLELLPSADPASGQERIAWPSPLRDHLAALIDDHSGRSVVALASGDPLVSGIAGTLIDVLGSDRVQVVPGVSSIALARARLGWPADAVEVVTLVGRDPQRILAAVAPGHRLIVLSSDATTPAVVAEVLTGDGYGASTMTVLGDLGTSYETRRSARADAWSGPSAALNLIAIACVGRGNSRTPGLADDAFEHDGQLTRRDARASALARLAPSPGQVLWDVGAGAGSIGIEWMRSHPSTRAIAIEVDAERGMRIRRNARRLGVPGLEVVVGRAPGALAGLAAPDAVFVGGGASRPGVLDAVLAVLRPGGRLVVHAVTHQTESLLVERYTNLGGELIRLQVETVAPIGTFTGWSPGRAIVQWSWQVPQ
ncbi:MAG: cobL [Marmoricola sp.]|nr:cobL [Marmoricola sp.]